MDKSREQFEEWAKESFGWGDGRFEMYLGEYVNGKIFEKWQAWQASRAALVVEFPKFEFASWVSGDTIDGYKAAVGDTKDLLDKAGVKWKE